jgi:predicted outer membrane protein
MNRRHAITTLSGVVAASALLTLPRRPALAQQAAASGTTIGAGDYKTQTLTIGTFSKEMSQLALTRAMHPKVKEFAGFETDEQTAVAQVLTDTVQPPPMPLDQTMQGQMAQLQAQQGKAFDAEYVRMQIQGHRDLYAVQQDFLNGMPVDRDREHIAVLARTVIQMHLTMLHDLQSMLSNA